MAETAKATERMCYTARRTCGCICFVASDLPDGRDRIAKEIGECLRLGLMVERMTVEQAKADPGFFRECPQCYKAPAVP